MPESSHRNRQEIIGRPTVLWRLERPLHADVECLSGELENGNYQVRIMRGGDEYLSKVFPHPGDAMRWALGIEREMIAQGWTKAAV